MEIWRAREEIKLHRDGSDVEHAQALYHDFARRVTHNDDDKESLEFCGRFKTQAEAHECGLRLMADMEDDDIYDKTTKERTWWHLITVLAVPFVALSGVIIAILGVVRAAAPWIEDRRVDELIHVDELIQARSFEELHRVLHVRVERNRRNRLRRRQLIAVLVVPFSAISGQVPATVTTSSRVDIPCNGPRDRFGSPLPPTRARLERTDCVDASSGTRRQAIGG